MSYPDFPPPNMPLPPIPGNPPPPPVSGHRPLPTPPVKPTAASEGLKQQFLKTEEKTEGMAKNVFQRAKPQADIKRNEGSWIGKRTVEEDIQIEIETPTAQQEIPAAKPKKANPFMRMLKAVINFFKAPFKTRKKEEKIIPVSSEKIKELPKSNGHHIPPEGFKEKIIETASAGVPPQSNTALTVVPLARFNDFVKLFKSKIDAGELDEGVFRLSPNEVELNQLYKLVHEENPEKFMGMLKTTDIITDSVLFKRVMTNKDLPLQNVKDLQLDQLIPSMRSAGALEEEIIKSIKEKISTLSPAEKEFVADYVKVIAEVYRKSWAPKELKDSKFPLNPQEYEAYAKNFGNMAIGFSSIGVPFSSGGLVVRDVFPLLINHYDAIFTGG